MGRVVPHLETWEKWRVKDSSSRIRSCMFLQERASPRVWKSPDSIKVVEKSLRIMADGRGTKKILVWQSLYPKIHWALSSQMFTNPNKSQWLLSNKRGKENHHSMATLHFPAPILPSVSTRIRNKSLVYKPTACQTRIDIFKKNIEQDRQPFWSREWVDDVSREQWLYWLSFSNRRKISKKVKVRMW